MKFWFSFFLFFNCYLAQVTGLDGWDLFIDPGHSQDENMGINGYSEAKEVLQVGLHLMNIFNEQTDIDTVLSQGQTTTKVFHFISVLIMQILLVHRGIILFTAMQVAIRIQTGHFYFGVN